MEQTAPVLTDQKFKFCFWTYISSCLGGYKFSSQDNGIGINLLYHLLQVVLYLLLPGLPFIFGMILPTYSLTLILSAIIPGVLNIILNTISLFQDRKDNAIFNENIMNLYEEESKFKYIIKAKSYKPEFLCIAILTPCYGFFAGSAYYFLRNHLWLAILHFITSCTMFYPLINTSPAESGQIQSQNHHLEPYSTMLTRPLYSVTFLGIILIADNIGNEHLSFIFSLIYIFSPILLILGFLGSYGSTLEYLMEQVNVIIFGCGQQASFIRTFSTIFFNFLISLLVAIEKKSFIMNLILGLIALFRIYNSLGTLGLEKKLDTFMFKVSNHNQKHLIYKYISTVCFGITIIATSIAMKDNEPTTNQLITIIVISLILFLTIWILTYVQKRMMFGIFRSFYINSNGLYYTTKILKEIQTLIQSILITFAALQCNQNDTYGPNVLKAFLIFRLYNLSHINQSQLVYEELFALIAVQKYPILIGEIFIYLSPIFFIIYRAIKNALRRFQIWPYAFLKMLTVKKQRVKNYVLLAILQFFLLPVSLCFLGVNINNNKIQDQLYLRCSLYALSWITIIYIFLSKATQNVALSIKKHETNCRSEHLQQFRLSEHLIIFRNDCKMRGEYYQRVLLSCENMQLINKILINKAKYIATIQIIEVSSGYLTVAIRGLESQETTSCHGVEAREIDRMITTYFDIESNFIIKYTLICLDEDIPMQSSFWNLDFCGSLTPYNSFSIESYEENQLKLTGIIESTDFIEGFKQIFIKMMCYYSLQYLNEDDRKLIIHLSENVFTELLTDSALKYFPDDWSLLIGLKEKFEMSAKTNDEDSNKGSAKVVKKQPDDLDFLLNDLELMKQGPVQKKKTQPPPLPKQIIQNQDDDILGMLDDLENNIIIAPPPIVKQKQQLIQPANTTQQRQGTPTSNSLYLHIKRSILALYVLAFNDLSFDFQERMNNELIYKLFKDFKHLKQIRQVQRVQQLYERQFKNSDNFSKVYLIVMKAIRMALKVSIETFSIEGTLLNVDENEMLQQIEQVNKECYVGMGHEQEWLEGMKNKIPNLWSLGFVNAQNSLVIYRSYHKPIQCFIFEMNDDIVRGIQANLQMELYFITNDDDERYSIQTHQQFLRNMIIESSEEPLGYAPFYSGPIEMSL